MRRKSFADFAAFITKPVKPSALFDVLVAMFRRAAHAGAAAQARRPKALFDPEMGQKHPLRILLAEDNATNQKLALRLLARWLPGGRGRQRP